jgi:hypothetical protein
MAKIYHRLHGHYLTGELRVGRDHSGRATSVELSHSITTGDSFSTATDDRTMRVTFNTPLSRAKSYPLEDALAFLQFNPVYEIHFPHGQ